MDSMSDSNLSDGMRELVGQGFSIRMGRERIEPEIRLSEEPRAQFRDLDVSDVQRLSALSVPVGAASTHGLTPATLETVTAAGRNAGTTEAGFEAVGEARSTTRGGVKEGRHTWILK